MSESENYYINAEGNTVFTSSYHKKKGSCCKSNCLHCPFGTTLNRIGVRIHPYTEIDSHKEIFDQFYNIDNTAQSLLASAFGESKKYLIEDSYLLSLKDIICGICIIKNNKLEDLKLLEHFSDQGISSSYIQSLIEQL